MNSQTLKHAAAIILAGGDAHRFPKDQPAIFQPLGDKVVIHYVLNTVRVLDVSRVIVTSHVQEVQEFVGPQAAFVWQAQEKGSGSALLGTQNYFGQDTTHVLVLYANRPLLNPSSLQQLAFQLEKNDAACTLLTTHLEKPHGNARVFRNASGDVIRSGRDCELADKDLLIKEVVIGAYYFEKSALVQALAALRSKAMTGLYLSDIVTSMAQRQRVLAIPVPDAGEALGIYSDATLASAEALLEQKTPPLTVR